MSILKENKTLVMRIKPERSSENSDKSYMVKSFWNVKYHHTWLSKDTKGRKLWYLWEDKEYYQLTSNFKSYTGNLKAVIETPDDPRKKIEEWIIIFRTSWTFVCFQQRGKVFILRQSRTEQGQATTEGILPQNTGRNAIITTSLPDIQRSQDLLRLIMCYNRQSHGIYDSRRNSTIIQSGIK